MTAIPPNPDLRLALLGGEGLRSQSAPIWQALRSLDGIDQTHMAVLPVAYSALPLSQSERRIQITRTQLSEFGFSTSIISQTIDSSTLSKLSTVYLPGGDQRTVVRSLQNTELWQAIVSATSSVKLIIASGGAAVAFGDRIFAPIKPYPAALDDLEFELLSGLGLLPNIVILPYFSWLQDAVIDKIRALVPQSALLGIDDQAALFSDPAGWRVLGLGIVSIYHPNQPPQTFDPGTIIPPHSLTPFP